MVTFAAIIFLLITAGIWIPLLFSIIYCACQVLWKLTLYFGIPVLLLIWLFNQ
jgi:hypothetical protein